MDGILSQDEINALLSGMDLSSSSEPEPPAAPTAAPIDESLLTPVERDAVGEIANISMGSSATTLYSLVNRKVNITTPVVTLANWETVIDDYQRPCVFIQIRYTAGLDGSNIMVLKEQDVKVITDLMMGGDGSNIEGELGELHLSAISEAMNQMMGSAATSMSTMLGKMIDISPPEASLIDLTEFKQGGEIASFLENTFVKIAFRMQIDDLVDSTIMQLYPVDFARSLYETFISQQSPEPEPEPEPQPYVPPVVEMPTQNAYDPGQMGMGMGMPQMNPQMGMPQMDMNMGMGMMPQMGMGMGMPQMNPQMGMPQMDMNMGMMPQMGMGMGMPQMNPQMGMNVQPAQFQSFNSGAGAVPGQENIGLIKDVPLEVTVELGRTKKSIADILDFAPGTIIELDKIAGEPIDVLVNGKFVAKGEVVVIEESFGIRVTEIIK
ncbi:MAG: flagellar motor switch phosphatase FliY [Lachnospiraceae bacterium]|nr:flagellar motor switch phosphatase FliY [Lachnospiraceae bacterium]